MQDGGDHLGGDGAAIEAGAPAGKVGAYLVGTSPAVLDGPVAQRHGPHGKPLAQSAHGELAQCQGIGRGVVGGVEHQHPGLLISPGREGQHPLAEPLQRGGPGFFERGQRQTLLQHGAVVQRAGPLRQRVLREGAARHIQLQDQPPGQGLGVHLSRAVHGHADHTPREPVRMAPDEPQQLRGLGKGTEIVHPYGKQTSSHGGEGFQLPPVRQLRYAVHCFQQPPQPGDGAAAIDRQA